MSSELKQFLADNATYKSVNPVIAASNEGNFTPFYITIAICSVILGCMIILNIIFCCSRHSDYWLDRHTGNRWVVSIWSTTPHKQPPLDYTELRNAEQLNIYIHLPLEDILAHRETEVPPSTSQQPLTSSEECLELHKRESDI